MKCRIILALKKIVYALLFGKYFFFPSIHRRHMLLFFASVRPMNTRELEADKEPLTVLHCEGENSIIVCLPFVFIPFKSQPSSSQTRRKVNIVVDLLSMVSLTSDQHKKKYFVIVASNV
jgi:hypothetical protein